MGHRPWGHKESDTTEHTHTHTHAKVYDHLTIFSSYFLSTCHGPWHILMSIY